MNDINEEKIDCQLLNLSNQNVLNCLEYIVFNSNYTIVLTIQKQIINSYFFKNNYLKHMSSIKVLRNDEDKINQLEYLQASNSILTIQLKRILIANLNGLNTRKFQLKIGHNLYGCCQKVLLNKAQNNLFITYCNQIHFFENNCHGWKCSQVFISGYRDEVLSICLNFQEDELFIYGCDGYSYSSRIYIYHKYTQQQKIEWVLYQTIKFWPKVGNLWGGFLDHLYFLSTSALKVYKKSGQSQDYIEYASSKLQTGSLIYCQCYENKFVLLVENDSISVMKINQQQQLDVIKQITIDMSAFKYEFYQSIRTFLTQDQKFLVIWNKEKIVIIEMIYI